MRKVPVIALLSVMASAMLSATDIARAESVAAQSLNKYNQKKAAPNLADVILTETNEPLSASGKLNIGDLDNSEAFVPQKKTGRYGIFNIDAGGTWSYVTNSALDFLKEGQSASGIFTVTSVGGTAATVSITLKGTNDPALLSSADIVLTETNAPLKTHGKLTIKDVDSPETFVPLKKIGDYGTFNIDASGSWSYVASSAFDYLNVGQSVSDIFTVSSADGTTTTVKITINGSNDPAILSTANVVLQQGSEPLSTGGKLTIKDADSPETFVAQSNVAGANGIFNIDAAGVWSYVANSSFDYLKAGQSVGDRFTVSSADGTTTTVKVTINGINDPAILSSADVVLTETNEPLSASGKLSIRDVDSPETFVAQKKSSRYGTFSINANGEWSYLTNGALDFLSADQHATDTFTVASADGTTTTVKITINGSNDPAILGSADVVLTETNEPLSTHGKLAIKDPDSPETFVAQKMAGDYGTFNIDTSGAWTYVTRDALDFLKADQSVFDSFTVSSADGTTTTVKVTINGSNDPAILSAADISVDETNEPLKVIGKLSIKDVDSPETFVAQSNVAGTNGVFNIDTDGAWTYLANSAFDELGVGQSVSDKFTVTSADGTSATVKVTIKGTNDAANLSSAEVLLTETNESLSASGKLTISDVDSPASFLAQKWVSRYGTLNIDASGAWTYVTNSPLDFLNVGRNGVDLFTVSSADGTKTTVKITINGTNDPAILSADDISVDETNVPVKITGKLTISDVDDNETFMPQNNIEGANGIFSIDASGAWTYLANSDFDSLNVGQSVGDSFIVSSSDGTTTTVKVTINGTNDPAILGAADVVLTETNAALSTRGKLTIKDPDSPETFVAQSNIAGTNGIFNIDTTGKWSYVANSALDELNAGRSAMDIFTVSSADGTATTVKITINGTNDPAILSSANIVMDETNEPLTASGKLTISDVDDPETFVAQDNVSIANGVFNIDPSGAWTYVANDAFDYLNEGDFIGGTIPVRSADGTITTIKITINGTNDPAILSAADVVLSETNVPLVTNGTLSISDVDSAQTFVEQSKVPGSNGIFNINSDGVWSYVANSAFDYLNVGDKLIDSFVVCAADGTTTTVKITINGTNDPAIMSFANVHLDEIEVPQKTNGKLTIKDPDNPEVFVAQTDVAGTNGVFNIDSAGVWTYVANSNFAELDKHQSVSDTFTVASLDGTTTTVKITIHGTEPSPFRGKFFGGKIGLVKSTATGATSAPEATNFEYGLQGGALQAGYNWDLKYVVFGVGTYFDWNTYVLHSNGVGYASAAAGFDTKLGLPVEDALLYVKLGYGYTTGLRNQDISNISSFNRNIAVGAEYNFAHRWSFIAEYKKDGFSGRNGSTLIENNLFMFGFNYYFDIPAVIKKAAVVKEEEIVIPDAELAPDAVPDAPPPP
ncbi:MAG: hypothetical protein HY016_06155 [Nitrosomonadales bacterium]|nr:hypothetical protein [Nitrosomonadales bacterium]